MSLLNDALKRVKRHGQSPASARETADYPFRPIDYEKPSNLAPILWMAGGILALLLLSGFLFFKWVGGEGAGQSEGASRHASSSGSPQRGEGSLASSPQPPGGETGPEPLPPALSTTNVAALQTNAAVSAAPASPGFGNIKLQGIYYRPTGKSSVLINGETLEEGEVIQEVKVKKIDRKSVTLEWRGQEKVLTLR